MSKQNRGGHFRGYSLDYNDPSPRHFEPLKSYKKAQMRETLMIYSNGGANLPRKSSLGKAPGSPSRVKDHIKKY